VVLEGVYYNINWANFKLGTSVFIPCLNCVKVRQKFLRVARHQLEEGAELAYKISIEDGVRGLRVWRM
jgi:hypothetical protein